MSWQLKAYKPPTSVQSLRSNPLIMLIDEVSRMQGRVKSLFNNLQEETGLKAMENLVLNAIVEADFTPTVSQIGRSLGHPRQVIQRAVNDLADQGIIERLPNPSHRGVPLLALTEEGFKLKQQSDTKALKIANAVLAKVESEQCEKLAHELKHVRKELESFLRAASPLTDTE